MEKTSGSHLCLGRFAGAQGVRGLVRLHSFTALPADILRYRPLLDAAGRELLLARSGHPPQGRHRNVLILRLEGLVTREEAQSLNGQYVYANRAALPPLLDEDDFYHTDLIGCRCVTEEGLLLGEVRAIHNFGAGDVLEVTGGPRGHLLLPFTKPVVPKVSIEENRLIVRPPAETSEGVEQVKLKALSETISGDAA